MDVQLSGGFREIADKMKIQPQILGGGKNWNGQINDIRAVNYSEHFLFLVPAVVRVGKGASDKEAVTLNGVAANHHSIAVFSAGTTDSQFL